MRGIRAEAAADVHVEALDRVVAVGDRHAAGDQPDVADVVLRAGVRAAGQVHVDRRVEGDPRLHPLGDRHRRVLGVGGRELAAGVAGAGDQAGADAGGLRRSGRSPAGAPRPRRRVRRRRRRSAGSARRSGGYRRRPARARCRPGPRICAAVMRPTGSATPTQTQARLLLRMHADVRLPVLPVGLGHLLARQRGSAACRAWPRRRPGTSRSPSRRART